MNTNYETKDRILLLKITEEIDHYEADKIRNRIDNEITKYMPRRLVFDFKDVTFMDSAGIGMVLGRYKMMHMLGGSVELINISPKLKKIFEMSGVSKIITIKEAV